MQSPTPTTDQFRPKTRTLSAQARVLCVLAVWLVLVGYGFSALIRYDAKPGEFGKPSVSWPVNDTISCDTNDSQLVMFIHPKCSCTRAAIAEVLTTLGRATLPCAKHFVFFDSDNDQFSRTASEYRELIQHLPDAKIYSDVDGELAAKFGVQTSSHILLYCPSGKLIFSGGITKARGHEGENSGRELLEDRLNNSGLEYAEFPVFGCSLAELRIRSEAL